MRPAAVVAAIGVIGMAQKGRYAGEVLRNTAGRAGFGH
jgi:hypothetical protein